MEVQKLFLAVANELSDKIEVSVQVPAGYDVGVKEGETVLFRRKPSPVKLRKGVLGGCALTMRVLVDGHGATDTIQCSVGSDDSEPSKEQLRALRAKLAYGVYSSIIEDRWEFGDELKSPEPLTATEVAGSLGTLGEEQSRSERNRAAFEQAKNTMSGHNMAPRGFEPISACRCEQCRRHRGESL